MAWHCSATTNADLVKNLQSAEIISSPNVVHAMNAVDRRNYMGTDSYSISPDIAYRDAPFPIGLQQTISAPHMHGYALELAAGIIGNASENRQIRILDIGAGSGYLTACLGRMVENLNGRVYGIERIPDLVDLARANILKGDKDLYDKGIIHIELANGWGGLSEHAPYDFIHVGAAATEVPRDLMEQLVDGGQMIVPVGELDENQQLMEITRDGDNYLQRKLMGVRYVPLVNGSYDAQL